MLWVLQVVETKPIKSTELHLRMDHKLQTFEHVGGYMNGRPFMRYGKYHTQLGITGTIYWITELSSV